MEKIDNPLENVVPPENASSNDEFEFIGKSEEPFSKSSLQNSQWPFGSNNSKKELVFEEDQEKEKKDENCEKEQTESKRELKKSLKKITELNDNENDESKEVSKSENQKTNENEAKLAKPETPKTTGEKSIPKSVPSQSKSKKSKKKKSKNSINTEKLKGIILNIYKNSIYYEFLKASTILYQEYLDYLTPIHPKKKLSSFVIEMDFGIVMLIKGKYFIKKNNWYSVPLEEPEPAVKSPKLFYNREYFVLPYTIIDDISFDINEWVLTLTSKVADLTRTCAESASL